MNNKRLVARASRRGKLSVNVANRGFAPLAYKGNN